MKTVFRVSIAIAVCGAALLWNGNLSRNMQQGWISSADARIGRPLTPMSYAGVARRTTRRAVAVGAAYGAAAAAGSGCVQAVDAYGRVYTRCY
jgi:hypothetical protein